MLAQIVSAAALPDYKVRIEYEDGATGVVDFSALVQRQGTVFERMAEVAFFAQVSVGERGRTLVWPGEIDFCADALRLKLQDSTIMRVESALAE